MDTVRGFVRRLSEVVASGGRALVARRARRIVLPAAARFGLEGTILRTTPFDPSVPVQRPGSTTEIPQLLEWYDSLDGGDGMDLRENDLGVDLAAILGLATGRKMTFANEVPLHVEQFGYTWFLETGPAMFDGDLYGPVEGDVRERVEQIISALVGLPERRATHLGGAIRMRNAACCLVESDPSSAYGLLVVALETLSRGFGQPSESWRDWDQAESWDKFIAQLPLSQWDADRLRERLLSNKQVRLKRTFVDYAANNLSESFWRQPKRKYDPGHEVTPAGVKRRGGSWGEDAPLSELVPTDPKILGKRLGRSYDARSRVFHDGARLDVISLIAVPGAPTTEPLPFGALRKILDHLLWLEIEKAAANAPELPEFQVRAEASDPSEEDRSSEPGP